MERRFHSPYAHWISGLVFELGIFFAFILTMIVVALLAGWIFG
ncbi:MAG TPA: hypothetical protein VLA05_02720 [Coriobacteriia bacterium]|nr:hypothetical protein [Coriobacteriia bacterium]